MVNWSTSGGRDWTSTLLGKQAAQIDPNDPRFQLQHGGQMADFIGGRLGQGGQPGNVQGATIAQGPQGQFRQGELQLMQQLQGVAGGQQKGAGEMAVQRQVSQALAGQQAGQRMARGGNAAIAARGAARAAGDLGVNAAGMSAQAAQGDQSQARGMLGQILGQGRSADIGLASTQAGLNQQANMGNQAAGLQQQGLNNQMDLGLLAQMLGMDQATLAAQLGIAIPNQAASGQQGFLGDILGAGGQLGAAALMSDKRLKKNVKDGDSAIREFLATLKPKEFDYKDEKHGKGRHLGVMAQDMEQSPLGREIVTEGPDGKMLDGRKAVSALLASVAHLHERLAEVEPAKAGKPSTSTSTSTSTEVRSPTSTSTEAYTADNFTATVTGGAGAGDTTVNIYPQALRPGGAPKGKRQKAA